MLTSKYGMKKWAMPEEEGVLIRLEVASRLGERRLVTVNLEA